MITKLFEFINNKNLVKTTIKKTLRKIIKINNNDSINFHETRSDDLVLEIEFDVYHTLKKQIDIEIEKLKYQLSKSGTYLTFFSRTTHQLKFSENDDDFILDIDYDKPEIEHYRLFIKDTHFKRIKPPRYLYHMTHHSNSENISKNGLEIRENEVFSNTPAYDHPKAIFASSKQGFFGRKNDDEWRIDTSKIKNKWWQDYNLVNQYRQKDSYITYESIPIDALELVKKSI